MTSNLPETAPVVIIGGGIIGLSTLYHLAQRGVHAVLLERKRIASGTTWHAAGIVGQLRDSTAQTELGKYTAKLFRDLEEETGQATGYKANGTINIALSGVRHEQLLRTHDHAARMGVPSQVLSQKEVAEKWPWIVTEDIQSGLFVPSNGQVKAWIKCLADPDWQFEIFDATSAYGLLTIHGPKSRIILQAISGDNLSNEAFPFGAAREIDMAYARGWAIRRSFLGELGYELMMPTEFTQSVYDTLILAGESQGLKHMGMFAMNACRLEKGFRHFGHDVGEDDTPFETELGFAVSLAKGDFLGKSALNAQRADGPATQYRTVSLIVEDVTAAKGPWLIHNEPIWKDGKIVGHVTSGDFGFRIDKMVGLASLHPKDGVTKAWIEEGRFEVQIAGELYPIVAQLAPFYDQKGDLMRG